MICVSLKESKLKLVNQKKIDEKRREIADYLNRKCDIAVFIGREKTTEAQRIAFTNTYAEYEGAILRLESEIRKLQA